MNPEIARRSRQTLVIEQYKEIEENNRMGKTRGLFKKLEIYKDIFRKETVRT